MMSLSSCQADRRRERLKPIPHTGLPILESWPLAILLLGMIFVIVGTLGVFSGSRGCSVLALTVRHIVSFSIRMFRSSCARSWTRSVQPMACSFEITIGAMSAVLLLSTHSHGVHVRRVHIRVAQSVRVRADWNVTRSPLWPEPITSKPVCMFLYREKAESTLKYQLEQDWPTFNASLPTKVITVANCTTLDDP